MNYIEEQKFKFQIEPFKSLQRQAYNIAIVLQFMTRYEGALEEMEENLDKQLKGEKSIWD